MRELLAYVNEVNPVGLTQTLESNKRYIIEKEGLTLTLPDDAVVGDIIGIFSKKAETDHPVIQLPAGDYAGDYADESTLGGTVTPSTALWCQNFYFLGPTTVAGGGKYNGRYWQIFGFGGYALA